MRLAALAILLALPAAGEGVYTYRLRGEVRLLLIWLGKDDVGGGRVTVTRGASNQNEWRDEAEVLFGSNPERVPKGVNRWGYAREQAEWIREPGSASPRLLATGFEGIMRHSPEASIDEALEATRDSKSSQQFLYDTTVDHVTPERASSEFRVLSAAGDFDYRSPEELLGQFREHVAATSPLRRGQLVNSPPVYSSPYGFLTALSELIRQAGSVAAKPATTFVTNSRLYKLEVLEVRPVEDARLRPEWKAGGAREVRQIRFRCFNTVKRTRTDFVLWVSKSGELQGIPVRIQLQPRWWLRLQMDLVAAR